MRLSIIGAAMVAVAAAAVCPTAARSAAADDELLRAMDHCVSQRIRTPQWRPMQCAEAAMPRTNLEWDPLEGGACAWEPDLVVACDKVLALYRGGAARIRDRVLREQKDRADLLDKENKALLGKVTK